MPDRVPVIVTLPVTVTVEEDEGLAPPVGVPDALDVSVGVSDCVTVTDDDRDPVTVTLTVRVNVGVDVIVLVPDAVAVTVAEKEGEAENDMIALPVVEADSVGEVVMDVEGVRVVRKEGEKECVGLRVALAVLLGVGVTEGCTNQSISASKYDALAVSDDGCTSTATAFVPAVNTPGSTRHVAVLFKTSPTATGTEASVACTTAPLEGMFNLPTSIPLT